MCYRAKRYVNRAVLCFSVFLLSVSFVAAQKKSFIVSKDDRKQQQEMSNKALKEDIGQETREAFNTSTNIGIHVGLLLTGAAGLKPTNVSLCAALSKPVGDFQIQLASLQKNFSHVIEALIENQRSFKKAGRGDLCTAHACIKKINADMQVTVRDLQGVQQRLASISLDPQGVQKMTRDMEKNVSNLKSFYSNMQACTCLKNA